MSRRLATTVVFVVLAAFSLVGFLQRALEHSYGPLSLAGENGPVQAIGNLAIVQENQSKTFVGDYDHLVFVSLLAKRSSFRANCFQRAVFLVLLCREP